MNFFFRQSLIFLILNLNLFRRREKPDLPFLQFLYVLLYSLRQNLVFLNLSLNLFLNYLIFLQNYRLLSRFQNCHCLSLFRLSVLILNLNLLLSCFLSYCCLILHVLILN